MENKRKINLTIDNDLKAIFKSRLDKKGFTTWKEFTDSIGEDNPRCFADWFKNRQNLKKETLEKAFDVLEIPKELIDIYTESEIRYKFKNN